MTRLYMDVNKEMGLLEESRLLNERRNQYRASASVQPETAGMIQNIESLHKSYSWLDPEVKVALASAGYGADHPVTQAIVQGDAKNKTSKPFGWSKIGDVVKGTARLGFTAMESAFEEFTGVIRAGGHAGVKTRNEEGVMGALFGGKFGGDLNDDPFVENFRGNVAKSGASTGRIAMRDVLKGKVEPWDVVTGSEESLGEGFFPGGAAMAEHTRQAERLQIDDQPISTGRVAANKVSSPGTTPYNVVSGTLDAGILWFADPADVALVGLGRAGRARKLFTPEDAGALAAHRNTILPERTEEWFNSKPGRAVVDRMAATNDFDELWKATKKKMPVDLAAQIADETDPNKVRDLLRPHLGTSLREKPTLANPFGMEIKRPLEKVRLFQRMPGSHMDLDDKNQAVEQLDRFMKNARMDDATVAKYNGKLARAGTRNEAFKVVTDVMGEADGLLVKNGVPAKEARKMTKMFADSIEAVRTFNIDAIGSNADFPGVTRINGTDLPAGSPHLTIEYIDNVVPLPNTREIRRKAGALKPVFDVWGVTGTVEGMDGFMSLVWRPFQLIRAAWTLRVVGEEQLRMGASGLTSMFAHPLSHLAYMTGRRGATDIKGNYIEDAEEFSRSLARGSMGFRDDPTGMVRTGRKVPIRREEEGFIEGWMDEIIDLHRDPVAKRVAGGWGDGDRVPGGLTGNHVEDAKRWFWNGPGKKFRKQIVDAGHPEYNDLAEANRYIDTVFERIKVKTGEDNDLLEAVASGKIGGKRAVETVAGFAKPSKFFKTRLSTIADEGIGPAVVKGDLMIHKPKSAGPRLFEAYNEGVQNLFNALGSVPTNKLSRSPAFKQMYWNRIEEVISFMDDATQVKIIDRALEANLSGAQIKRMRQIAGRGSKTDNALDIDNADLIAKSHALDSSKKLLYDLHDKSQFSDINRNFFPFMEAWKEIMTVWAKLAVQRPQNIRKGQKIIGGLRNSGVFHEDPDTGEEMFTYPGSELLTEKTLGVPIPLEARASGLNLFAGSVLPGFGPAVTYPASKIIPDTPRYTGMKEILFPYGESGLIDSVIPSWARKMGKYWADPQRDTDHGNTVFDVAKYLQSTGKYGNSQAEIDRMMRDAGKKAQWLSVIRAMGAATLPSSPSPQFLALDKNGSVLVAQQMANDYYDMVEKAAGEGRPEDDALGEWLEKYGEDAFLTIQSKSRLLTYGPPSIVLGKDAVKWARKNEELVREYPSVYWLFAPKTGEPGEFAGYHEQVTKGERQVPAPEIKVRLANARLGNFFYQKARTAAGPSPTDGQREILREIKSRLKDKYPGFGENFGVMGKVSVDQAITELEGIVATPQIADTNTGKALSTYLQAREIANQKASQAGVASFKSAKSMRGVRDVLRAIGLKLSADNPDFAPIFDQVLDREMKDDNDG